MADLNHIYRRAFDPDGQDSLAKIARVIAPGSQVLDVGCGPGVLGEYLTHERGCVVDGVDRSAEAASVAARSYRKVVVADLETYDLRSLGDAAYDYIVCADVLEHLPDPTVLARRLVPRLSKTGRLLFSIPNVAYAGVIAGLMNGEFRYSTEGLLDTTHLRFFTRRSLAEWLSELGLHVLALDTVRVELADSEFAEERLESFAPAVKRQLLASEDALTYQFIVQASPAGEPPRAEAEARTPDAALTFLCQLFYRTVEDDFHEERSVFARARMGVGAQRIRFALPPLPPGPLTLRLDVADRPGFLRLYDLAVYDSDRGCVWKWDGTRAQLDRLPSSEVTFIDDDEPGQLMVSLGDAPRIEIALPPGAPPWVQRGSVEVDLSWPMSTDALAVTRQLGGTGLVATLADLEARRNLLVREHRRVLVERDRFERERAVLERALASRETSSTELNDAREEIAALKAALNRINESLTFRLGRPVFAVVNRLRALRRGKR